MIRATLLTALLGVSAQATALEASAPGTAPAAATGPAMKTAWDAASQEQDLDQLVQAMTQPGWAISSYQQLRRRKDPRCVPLLLRAAPSMEGRGQYYTVLLLESLGPAEAEPACRRLLDAASPELRFLAARYLHARGEEGMATRMAQALDDPALPSDRRGAVLGRAAGNAPPQLRPVMLGWLNLDADPALVDAVLRHLLATKDGSSVAAIEPLLQHPQLHCRLRAAAYLVGQGNASAAAVLVQCLREGKSNNDWRLARPYLAGLPRLPARLREVLIEQLEAADKLAALTPLLEILRQHPTEAARSRLLDLLDHDAQKVRAAAFDTLDWNGDWEAQELVPILESSDPALCVRAADALRRMDDLSGLPRLIELASNEGPSRAPACRSLAACRIADAVAPLIDALESPTPAVRTEAAAGLESVLWSLYPYRRFALDSTGYAAARPVAANQASVATIRSWWERHQGADW